MKTSTQQDMPPPPVLLATHAAHLWLHLCFAVCLLPTFFQPFKMLAKFVSSVGRVKSWRS